MPEFRFGLRRYYGPQEKLFNLIFDEFLEAQIHYGNYRSTGNPESLNKLVATLYRPQRKDYHPKALSYNGDRRQPFNAALVPYYARKFKRLSMETKHAVMLFFEGCLQFLDINFPHAFGNSESSSPNRYGPLSLVDALSGEDVTKNEKIRQTMLYDVMVRLEQAAVSYNQLKEKLKTK